MSTAASTEQPLSGHGAPPARRWSRPLLVLLGLTAVILLGMGLSIAMGASGLTPAEVWHTLHTDTTDSAAATIIWSLRMPRAVLALLVGAHLAMAGVLLQAVMRNPLAAPDIVGVTAGAGLAATATLVLAQGLPVYLPLTAFAGGMAAAVAVATIAWQPGQGTSPVRMVLAGVAVGVMLGAVTSFLMVAFGDRVQQVVFWMAGSLVDASWAKVRLTLPYTLVGMLLAVGLVPSLNVMQLGESAALGLGAHVQRTRFLAMAAASILAASAVSVSGMIGFVGLVVPHLARLAIGHQHGRLLPIAGAGGAALLLWADLAARTMLAPSELPVGILTALLGGPYFIFLLYRRKLL